MPALHNKLVQILDDESLTPHFQPIISLAHKDIIGYEALIRGPADGPLHTPMALFDTAKRFNLSTKLEFTCRKISIQRYARLNLSKKLFINVSPSVLLQPDFKNGMTLKFLKQAGLDPKSVVIELTENQPTDNYQVMRDAVTHYRNMGFEIALDDLGAGYSGLRLWSELLPEYVKIDKHFIQGIHENPIKLNFVRSIQSIANALHCNIIAEGVETENEFKTIANLGITHAQGYYFAKPGAVPVEQVDNALFVNRSPAQYQANPFSATTASHIAKFITPVSSATPIAEVMHLFQHNPDLSILPLVDDHIASGIIFRDRFLSKLFSSRYGLELYGKKPINSFVSKSPLSIEHNTPIEAVSQQLTSAVEHDPAFIVTLEGEYAGIATLLDLLEEMTRQQIRNAKHANPLTLLPGSVPVNERINHLLAGKTPFAFAYFDLDNFKPFNDVYGYSAGDNIIKAVAHILSEHLPEQYGLVGHIGGDDFIVVFTCHDWLERCKAILAGFEAVVPSYYKADDIKAGGIHTENRKGKKCFFPMISLSVGIVDPTSTKDCRSHVDIADLASGAKKQAKNIDGNSMFINQRKLMKHTDEATQPLPA
ncbi:MAG: bifunctional diguanylate cyclase/phosphodiesterase [Methylovulum sp.]|nr:bifunctional diguanylate cyclase/phosphodiesterase [Methylovulum sp.]